MKYFALQNNATITFSVCCTCRYMEAMKKDKFALNFSQFYQLLLRITEIVYPDLYPVDEPYAFNKFLAVRSFDTFSL